MEQSAHSKEILKLGEKIVKELNLYEGVDTLSKWMCHYIAELMHKAKTSESEEEKAAAERECCELILKIWNKREVKSPTSNLYPLSGMEEIIEILKNLKESGDFLFRNLLISTDLQIDSTNKWSKLVEQAIYTAKNTTNLALLVAIAEQELNSKINWTKDYVNLLSENEKLIIELLDFSFENRTVVFTGDDKRTLIDLTPAERNNLIFQQLENLIEQQKEVIENIKNINEEEK